MYFFNWFIHMKCIILNYSMFLKKNKNQMFLEITIPCPMYGMCILMSSIYLVFKSFSFEVIYSLVWPGLTKPRLGFSKQVNWVFSNFSKCKNVLCIKGRPWWDLTMLYSIFFSFEVFYCLVLPSLTKSNIGFFRKYTLTGSGWSQMQKS